MPHQSFLHISPLPNTLVESGDQELDLNSEEMEYQESNIPNDKDYLNKYDSQEYLGVRNCGSIQATTARLKSLRNRHMQIEMGDNTITQDRKFNHNKLQPSHLQDGEIQ
jgi:hypothetical protein